MKPLLYIIRKSVKNRILELKKKPSKIIAYLFFILLLIFCFVGRKGSTSHDIFNRNVYSTGAAVLILLFSVPDLLSSLNKGSTFFRGADVNLVFTAPISPQNVLVYGFIKQMYTILISLIFVLFQLPNLMRFRNIEPYAGIIIILGFFILILFNSILKVLIYSITSKNESYRATADRIFKGIGILAVIAYLMILYKMRSPLSAAMALFNNKYTAYIPVYGWVKEIFMSAIDGISIRTAVYLLLTIAAIILCMFVLYSLETDYYEDVLEATERIEKVYSAKRDRSKYAGATLTLGKVRKVAYTQKGEGGSAIFFRHVLECKKTGFGFISMLSIIYAIGAIVAGIFMPAQAKDIRMVLGFSAYMLLLFSMAGGRWQQELGRPYIYMIPEDPMKKVIYSTIMDNIKNIIDGSILFIIIGILFKSDILSIILCVITYVSMGAVLIYAGVLTKRIFGDAENVVMVSLIRMGIMFLIIVPDIIGFVSMTLIFKSYSAYAVVILYNVIFSGIIILLSKGIFENIELS